jgi:hydrogenase maturation factor
MHHTKHSVIRMSQRGISHAMADLVYAYGFTRGDKVILNQKAAKERLIEARAEKEDFERALNTGGQNLWTVMHTLATLDEEIRNLTKLIDKQGVVVVVDGDVLLTAYGIH